MGKIIGFAAVVAFTAIIASFMNAFLTLQYPVSPPSPLPAALWLWTYRGFDVIFLCLLIFVAIVGAAALFRAEEPSSALEEAAFVEGALVEEEEEE